MHGAKGRIPKQSLVEEEIGTNNVNKQAIDR